MTASVVLPCYNPQTGWERTICDHYLSFCKRIQDTPELILVMDGISHSVKQAELDLLKHTIPTLRLLQYPVNHGKGYAIRQGVKEASGAIIIYTDADFPYTEDSLYKVYEQLKTDECDVAIGVKDGSYYTHVPFVRNVISRSLRFFIRFFLSVPITDTQCGLKGFKQKVAPLFLQTTINRYLFDLEFIRNCYKNKTYRIKTVTVTLKENVHFRKMNYRVLISETMNFIKLISGK